MRSVLLKLIVLLVFVGCSNRSKVPAHIMNKEKMSEVMWDLARADALILHRSNDSSFDKKQESVKLYEQVFRIHNTSLEKFKESLKFYEENPEILKVMMDTLRSYERRVLDAQKPTLPVSTVPTISTDTVKAVNPVIEQARRQRDSIRNFQRVTKPIRD